MSIRNRVTWIALICAVTFGCSRLPTAPELPARSTAITPEGSAGVRILEPIDPILEPDPGPGVPPIIEPDTLIHVQPIEGIRGANVKVCLVEVDLPPGACTGNAEVHVTLPDSMKLEVHLDIYPASMNHFEVPVDLTFDLTATLNAPEQKIFWFDETIGDWVEVPSTYDPVRRTLTSKLHHFSMYKVAKASWAKASWGIQP